MSTIQDYFVQSQLSLAAYAIGLQPGMFGSTATSGNSAYQVALEGAGMSVSQAADFANTYTVLAQSSDALTGFSATLFENTATRQKCLAIGGTVIGENNRGQTTIFHKAPS